jgi:protein lysine acetyltransferase
MIQAGAVERLEDELAARPPFEGGDAAALRPLAAALVVREHAPGAVLYREGEPGASFVVVLDGLLRIEPRADVRHDLELAGPGSILGELAVLTGRPRTATVTAATTVRAAHGDRQAFDLLVHLPGVADRLARTVAERLAVAARVVPVALRDGSTVGLRPLLPDDRDDIAALIGRQDRSWLRSRFFVAAPPPARTLAHLVDIDYVDHFAWVVDASASGAAGADRAIAVGRYVRAGDHATAEVAFGVAREHQGRGIATLLLGALAVTAATTGIATFTAEVLADNAPMLAVFRRVGARSGVPSGGVVSTRFDVAAATGLLDGAVAAELVAAARDIATGAGLALAQPALP